MCVSVGRLQSDYLYTVNGFPINRVYHFKDLGVIIDSSLNFKYHVNKVRLSCYRLINLAFKVFAATQPSVYIKFYNTYVVPVIDYCSPLYVNISASNAAQIEKIPRFFSRRLYRRLYPSKPVPSYSVRLKLFGMQSYGSRSKIIDLTVLYRFINGSLVIPGIELIRSLHKPGRFLLSRPLSSLERSFFIHRTLTLWNKCLSCSRFVSFNEINKHISSPSFLSFNL